MANPKVKFKRSSVAGKSPGVGDLPLGELAINTHDGRVYTSKSTDSGITTSIVNISGIEIFDETTAVGFANTLTFKGSGIVATVENGVGIVTVTSGGAGSTPGGISGNIQYNDNNSFAGSNNLTFNGNDVYVAGVVTATNFTGNLTGTATTATNLSDAANITTGTINSSRLSGTYNINISGNADSATYASTAGIATNATYATTAGVSTNVIGGIASVTQLNVSGVSTLGTSNISGDLTFTGNNDIYLKDGGVINFGDGNDLQIFHNGSVSVIRDGGTGGLLIDSDSEVKIAKNGTGNDNLAVFTPDGSVELYYDNSKKFETLGVGVTVTGTTFTNELSVSGVSTFAGSNVKINSGNSLDFGTGAGDLHIYRQSGGSNDSIIKYDGSYNFKVLSDITTLASSAGSVTWGVFGNNGVELYYSNSKKFETLGVGVTITGTTFTNQLSVSGVATAATFSGSGASLTNLNASNLSSGIVPSARITETSPLTVNGDLYVSGNISFGGTTTQLNTSQLTFSDPDIVLGVGTTSTFNPTDNTANHGGIAIASTEGSPLVNLNISPAEVLPPTYKKIMWFKNNAAGLGTDAWLFNYAVGIGSTQFPSGTRLASGNVQFTENDLAVVRNINSSGIITATSLIKSGGTSSQFLKADGSVDSTTYASETFVGLATVGLASVSYVDTQVGLSTTGLLSQTGNGINLTGIVTSITAGTNITVDQSTGNVTINAAGGSSSQWVTTDVGIHTLSNVGVGTTNPSSKLTVSGEILSLRENTTQEGGQIAFARALDNASAYSIDCYNDSGQGTSPRLRFIDNIAGAERVSIDKTGNLLVGTGITMYGSTGIISAISYRGDGSQLTGVSGGLTVSDDTSTNATRYLLFDDATSGTISAINVSSTKLTFNPSTGNLVVGGTVTASSDKKIKENVKTIENALDKVLSLRGVEYDRTDTKDHQIGVIAQEIEKIIPEVVYGDDLKSVAYGNIVAVLIEAIKEQNTKIEKLEKTISDILDTKKPS